MVASADVSVGDELGSVGTIADGCACGCGVQSTISAVTISAIVTPGSASGISSQSLWNDRCARNAYSCQRCKDTADLRTASASQPLRESSARWSSLTSRGRTCQTTHAYRLQGLSLIHISEPTRL